MDNFQAAWEAFIRYEEREHAAINKKLDRIETRLEDLMLSRAKLYGAAGIISLITGTFGAYLVKHLMG